MLRKAIEEWNRRFIFDRAAWVHNSDGFNRAVAGNRSFSCASVI